MHILSDILNVAFENYISADGYIKHPDHSEDISNLHLLHRDIEFLINGIRHLLIVTHVWNGE